MSSALQRASQALESVNKSGATTMVMGKRGAGSLDRPARLPRSPCRCQGDGGSLLQVPLFPGPSPCCLGSKTELQNLT